MVVAIALLVTVSAFAGGDAGLTQQARSSNGGLVVSNTPSLDVPRVAVTNHSQAPIAPTLNASGQNPECGAAASVTAGGDVLLSVLGSVTLVLFGHLVLRLVIDPMVELRTKIANVSSTVLARQYLITNGTFHPETAAELRKCAGQLRAAVAVIPCYRIVAWRHLPTKKSISDACGQLNLLAYGTDSGDDAKKGERAEKNHHAPRSLAELLNIETSY